jgi:hypothetical protein
MRFTFKREAAIMTALLCAPILVGLIVHLFRVLFVR